MKKLLFIFEGAQEIDLQSLANKVSQENNSMIFIKDNVKIFQIDDGEIEKIYPEQEYEEEDEEDEKLTEAIPKVKSNNWKEVKPTKDWRQKYPDEMKEFVEKHMNQVKNPGLCEMINKKFDFEITTTRLSSYMYYSGLRRDYVSSSQKQERKEIKSEESGNKYKNRKKKYPDEMRDFIKENIDDLKNPELVEEINEKWGVGINVEKLKSYFNSHGIKRTKKEKPKIEESLVKDDEPEELESEDFESEEQESEGWKQSIHYNEEGKYLCNSSSSGLDFTKDIESVTCKNCVRILEKREEPKRDPKDLKVNGKQVPRDIMDFIETNKDMEPIVLRDEIIEMFEKNFKLIEIKSMQNQFKEKNGTLPPQNY